MATTDLTTPQADTVTPDPDRPIRIAVVGCGAIAKQMHLPVLAGHPDFELVALVDRDRNRAEQFARGYNVPHVFNDASELTTELVDAAVIATPPAFHADCSIDMMRKGIHILVEKPMAMTIEDAERMVEATEETGCTLSVGFFRRLFPSIRLLKGLIDREWAGEVQSFTVAGGGMYNWAAATLANMKKETAGGGVLMDFGAHLVDLMFALFDSDVEILDYKDNAVGGIEADCSIEVMASHQGRGVKGQLEFSRLRELGSFIRVECERATLEFQITERHRIKVTPKDLTLTDFADGSLRDAEFQAGWVGQDEGEDWYATFAEEFDDFRRGIVNSQSSVLSGRSSLKTTHFIEDCYRSQNKIEEPWVSGGLCARPPVLRRAGIKRVLVTGASGFIGCRVAEVLRLSENLEVRAVVNNPANASRLSRLDVEMVQADLVGEESLRSLVEGCDAVIHCAVGTAYGDPQKIKQVTVNGTKRLGEAALACGVQRFVHLSSMAVYGTDDEVPNLIEEGCAHRAKKSTNYYGWTKLLAEQALTKLWEQGLPVVMLRPGRVFGPFGKTFITNPLQAMSQGRFGWGGDPDSSSDMVYVDNVVSACLQSIIADLSQVGGGAFNVTDREDVSWREFYSRLAGLIGFELDDIPVIPRNPGGTPSTLGRVLRFPANFFRASASVVASAEFKKLGRKVLNTDPIGTLPRMLLERSTFVENVARKVVRADGSLPVWDPSPSETSQSIVAMGAAGARLSLERSQAILGYQSPVSLEESIPLTADWARYSQIVK